MIKLDQTVPTYLGGCVRTASEDDRQTGRYEDALRNYEILLKLRQWAGLSRDRKPSIRTLRITLAAWTSSEQALLYERARNDGCHPVRIDVESQERQRRIARISPLVHHAEWLIYHGAGPP